MTTMRHGFDAGTHSGTEEWLNLYRYLDDQSHHGHTTWPSREEADAWRQAYFARAREIEPQGVILGYNTETAEIEAMWLFDAKRVRGTSFWWARDCRESLAVRVK